MSQGGGSADVVTPGQLSIERLEQERRIAQTLVNASNGRLARWLSPAERRLELVENGVAHMKAIMPGLERECAAIRQSLRAVREQLERPA